MTTTTIVTYEIYVDKQEIAGGEKTGAEVIGAALEVVDTDGNVIDSWISDGSRHWIGGLEEGVIYTLTETGAPDGYAYAESIRFTWRDGAVWIVESDDSLTAVVDGTIVMYDERIVETTTTTIETTVQTTTQVVTYDIHISKQEILDGVETGKEVPGASLELRSEDGTLIDAWISGDEPHYIEGLTEGILYTLTETLAPEGYEIAESISFIITDGNVFLVEDGTHTQADFTIVMLDRYVTTQTTTTAATTTESVTTAATTSAATTEATTTTATTAKTTTTVMTTETTQTTTLDLVMDETVSFTTTRSSDTTNSTTTAMTTQTSPTRTQSAGTSSSNRTNTSSGLNRTNTSSSPKTGDRTIYSLGIVGGLGLLIAAAAVMQKKR